MKWRVFITVLSAVAGYAVAGGGGGLTGGSTEVTQLLNNTELAIQTARQQAQYALQLEQKYRELLQLAPAQLQHLPGSIEELREAASGYKKLRAAAENLHGSLQGLQSISMSRYHEFSATGLTWRDYIEREKRRSELLHGTTQVLREHETEAFRRVDKNYAEIQAAAADIKTSDGIHASTMQLNAQMNQLLRQMNQIYELQAQRSLAATTLDADAAAQRERGRREAEKQTDGYLEGQRQDREMLEYLRRIAQ